MRSARLLLVALLLTGALLTGCSLGYNLHDRYTFDLVDGWFAARFRPDAPLAHLADRLMDKLVYSIIFPVIAVGMMWRLLVITPDHTKGQLLHAVFVLLLCVTVLIRDNFAAFMRGFAIRQGSEPALSEYNRLRTIVAAPVSALLYAVAVVKARVFVITKIIVYIFGVDFLFAEPSSSWLVYIAAFTIIAASVVALRQQNLKRLLAYSSVENIGIIFIGLGLSMIFYGTGFPLLGTSLD